MMKYNANFERDFLWYLKMRNVFTFDGKSAYNDKRGNAIIVYSKFGKSGKEAFYLYDSNGTIHPTKHPLLFKILLRTKGAINLMAKEYAIDRATGLLPKYEFEEYCRIFEAPDWFYDSVERQKFKYMPYYLMK